MESPYEVTGPCNLGNCYEASVRDIARLILEQTGSRSPLVNQPLPEDDPKRRQPVINRALELLGWRPAVELDQGLRRTIDYFALKVLTQDMEATVSPLRPEDSGRFAATRAAHAQPPSPV